MNVSAAGFAPVSLGQSLIVRAPGGGASQPAPVPSRAPGLDVFAGRLLALRSVLADLSLAARVRTVGGSGGPKVASARSAVAFSLTTSATPTTLRSTEEVNATPTSFSPYVPAISGSSSVEAALDGVYDGSLGDDTLTFRFTSGGVLGLTPIQVAVEDGTGATVDTLSFGLGYSAGTPLALDFGLTLALDGGIAVAGDTFQVAVSASVGSAVDRTRASTGRATTSRASSTGRR